MASAAIAGAMARPDGVMYTAGSLAPHLMVSGVGVTSHSTICMAECALSGHS